MAENQKSPIVVQWEKFRREFKRQAVDSGAIGERAQKLELACFFGAFCCLLALSIGDTFFIIVGLINFLWLLMCVRIIWKGEEMALTIVAGGNLVLGGFAFAGMIVGFISNTNCIAAKEPNCGSFVFAGIMWLILWILQFAICYFVYKFKEQIKFNGGARFGGSQGTADPNKAGDIEKHPEFTPDGLEIYSAMYDFEGEAGDLSFKQGDKIVVLQKDESGWWKGYVVGREEVIGLLPAPYIE